MPQTTLSDLEARVSEIVARSNLAPHLEGVNIEVDRDGEGSDFLRVMIGLDTLDGVADADLEGVIGSIEDSLLAVDERFPSVRFLADAA